MIDQNSILQTKVECIVLLSGGLDSATAALWAKKKFKNVIAINFYYKQKQRIETKIARRFARSFAIPLICWKLNLKCYLRSALLQEELPIGSSLETNLDAQGVPVTYVPFRNGIMLSLAAAFAESQNCFRLVTGFNTIDAGDYPDTTPQFIRKMEAAINCGTTSQKKGERFKIFAPLIRMNKAEIIKLGLSLGLDFALTYSCYRGTLPPCGSCPSCLLRAKGFAEAGLSDPLLINSDNLTIQPNEQIRN